LAARSSSKLVSAVARSVFRRSRTWSCWVSLRLPSCSICMTARMAPSPIGGGPGGRAWACATINAAPAMPPSTRIVRLIV